MPMFFGDFDRGSVSVRPRPSNFHGSRLPFSPPPDLCLFSGGGASRLPLPGRRLAPPDLCLFSGGASFGASSGAAPVAGELPLGSAGPVGVDGVRRCPSNGYGAELFSGASPRSATAVVSLLTSGLCRAAASSGDSAIRAASPARRRRGSTGSPHRHRAAGASRALPWRGHGTCTRAPFIGVPSGSCFFSRLMLSSWISQPGMCSPGCR